MPRLEPKKLWWTAAELADARLPDMPGSKRGINHKADQEAWRTVPDCSRRKEGRGGGWQFHWTLLPLPAREALLVQDAEATRTEPRSSADVWHVFDQLKQRVKDEAERRRKVLERVDAIYAAGHTHVSAVAAAASEVGKSPRTVYGWISMVEGVAYEDRLPYLAPRHSTAKRQAPDSKNVRPFLDFLKSSYLRIAPQTFRQCHRKAVQHAKAQGWEVLTERTALRRIEAEVPYVERVLKQEGFEGLMRCFPAQIRDRTTLTALEGVNADCHKLDVFVEWPDGTVDRPQMVAFQDLYSNKFLSWRVDHSPNAVMVMAAFGEMVEEWGIPKKCLFDNGREFANKWMTGGAPTRFRFKIREDDPTGILPQLGIDVKWATPAHGQAKPIERAFRDIASDVARDPRFSGAYVGNRPDAKPENYGNRAVPLETFLKVLSEGIAEHNARSGRLTPAAKGRSFDETFAESYAVTPIRRATEEQRRLWLMGQHVCKLNKANGSIKFHDNVYHSEWMSNHPSRRVVARFDPEKLWDGLSIYDVDGAYLGFAECQQKVGFFDVMGAKKQARQNAKLKRAVRDLAKAQTPMSVDEVAAAYDGMSDAPAVNLEAKVVAPEFGKAPARLPHQKPSYQPAPDAEVEAMREAMIHQLPVKKTTQQQDTPDADTPAERFWRAQDLLEREAKGKEIGQAEAEWVLNYVEGAEYQGQLSMYEAFGASGIV